MTKLILVRYEVDFGRMGDLYGLFVTTLPQLQATYGKNVYWGEVLGKHSEVEHELDQSDYTIISDDQSFLKKLVEILGNDISGFNPITRLAEYGDEDDDVDA